MSTGADLRSRLVSPDRPKNGADRRSLRGNLRASPDSETQLGLLAIVDRETLQHEASKTTASTTTDSIVDHESLQASAVIGKLADAVEHQINNLLTLALVR